MMAVANRLFPVVPAARLAPDRLAATRARQLAAEAVTDAGRNSLVEEVQQLVGELVASAVRRTTVPVEVTIDTHDGVIRVEVHDEAPVGPDATTSRDPRGAGSLRASATVWAEHHREHAG
jgi:hypothetical protein